MGFFFNHNSCVDSARPATAKPTAVTPGANILVTVSSTVFIIVRCGVVMSFVRTCVHLILLLVCMSSGLLVSQSVSAAEAKRIVFINPGFEGKGFWQAVSQTMSAAASSLGFELEILYSDRQWPKMLSNGRSLMSRIEKPDYLILVNEHQQAPELMLLAEKQGIKTILLLNSLTPEQTRLHGGPRQQIKHWLGSLTPDNNIAGYEIATSVIAAAREAGGGADGQIDMIALAGDFKTPASLSRLQGLQRALEQNKDVSLDRRFTVNWSFEKAHRQTELWLRSQQPLDAIWAANDPIALGSIKALKEAGKQPGKDVMVAGLNWSAEALTLVQNGEMTLTHGGHFLAGAWIMVLLYDYDNGTDFAPIEGKTAAAAKASAEAGANERFNVRFPMTAIDSKNVGAYKKLLGDSNWSRIDFKRFSRNLNPGLSEYDFSMDALLNAVSQ